MTDKISQKDKKFTTGMPGSAFRTRKTTTGFTLIEIMIAITIILIIGAISVSAFINWQSEKKMDGASDIVASVLEESRGLTINAYGGNQYGVYLGTNDRVISFVGATYNPVTVSNTTTLIPSGVTISTSTLGTAVVFQKFSGSAGVGGIIVLSDNKNASNTRTIMVDTSGAVSVKK
jgi:prepilin-type N-terminal cleavage/methylation domain-containing protein